MTVNVDWCSMRPLNGGRDKGFEEFCSQLARSEVARRARFVRKGSPDAGVECYAIFGSGSEAKAVREISEAMSSGGKKLGVAR